ncbi:MAG: peptide deformylase [Bacteroidetes bacterium]|nr:peptide deformylase [Bacteroidota bacterium]
MVLPIVAYGDPILRKKGEEIKKNYPGLAELIKNMFDTMEQAKGVGLAAPQVNKAIRLFIVDSRKMYDDEDGDIGIREVFINAQLLSESGMEWAYEEGCLSIPQIREDVFRQETIRIKYLDNEFRPQEKEFNGLTARVIQHEYDHIEGKLFIDYLKPLKKSLLKSKLDKISKGEVSVDYKMKFPKN